MQKKMLVAYSASSTFTSTIVEYLVGLKKYVHFDIDYLHVTHDAIPDFDLNDYDVVFHNFCARLCFEGYVSEAYREELKNFRGLKIVSVQDDYDRTSVLHRQIRELGFHVVVTCIQPEFWHLAYPEAEIPGVTLVQALTGYVPEDLSDAHVTPKPLAERTVTVSYRGGHLPAKYGRLGWEKCEIGRYVREECERRGVSHDISTEVEDRVYGDDWYALLANSRAVLGAESGSNAFDFDGSIERREAELSKELQREATYSDLKEELDRVEEHFNVGQISPRVFECALLKSPMVLFRGSYSDALEPDVDYICLEKDFSNLDDVFAQLQDLDHLERVANNAYRNLIESGQYNLSVLGKIVTDAANAGLSKYISTDRNDLMRCVTAPWAVRVERARENSLRSQAMTAVLSERATEKPLSVSDFEEKLIGVLAARAEDERHKLKAHIRQVFKDLRRVFVLAIGRAVGRLFGRGIVVAIGRNPIVRRVVRRM
ncbi:hypothetical protein QMT40_000899 [Parvibaculaceae bacterium PLY_AMNH_Bact1]|nr:hypothetical protein QMT40_000899 [Parvibaculaceae bacterium PLY_AMNH_Bact1]